MFKKITLLLIVSLLWLAPGAQAQQYVRNGSATIFNGCSSGTGFQLTPAATFRVGSVWFQNKITLNQNFTIEADLYLGTNDANGADGIAFVLQPVCNGIGIVGEGLGYGGINPSLAVEFDTWRNGNRNDPAADHLAIQKNGVVTHGGANTLAGPTPVPNLENGQWHTFKFEWNAITKNLKVYFDNNSTPFYNLNNNIVNTIFSGNANVFWGFSGATGSAVNNQRVCITNVSFTEEGSFVTTPPACPGGTDGSIDLDPAGGIGPFTYTWGDGPTTEDRNNISAGAYSVTVTDGNGCQSRFNITVPAGVDNTNPSITCPGNILKNNDPGACGAVATFANATAADNCPGVTVTQTGGLPSGSSFPVGTNPVTFTATDGSGNTATCSFNVTVTDNEAPTISCPGNISQANDSGVCGAAISFAAATGADNCPGATVAQTGGPASGSVFPVGSTPVTYTVTDGAGLTATCSFNVTVTDNEAPDISCPNNISQANDSGVCGAAISFAAATGADNCPGATVAQTGGPASGSVFPVGSTPVTYTVTDAAGLTATCSFNVTVTDNEAPDISCPGNISQANDSGVCGAAISFAAATGADNCPGATVAQTGGPASGSVFPVGSTPVTYTVTDAAGLTAMCSFNVTVTDTEAPDISCPGNISQANDSGVCGAAISFAAATGADNCPGATVAQTGGPASGSVFPVGSTPVTYTVTDAAGLTATCSFNVTVTDNEAPDISCPNNISQANDSGVCGAAISFAAATGADNCPGATVAQTGGPASGSVFPVGSTPVTYTVTDAAGLTATCSFNVTVTDNEAPTISCPGDIAVSNDDGICGALLSYTITGNDNCSGSSINRTAGLASGAIFPLGTTPVSHTITDGVGLTASCSFNVTVSDNESPVISNCPGNQTVNVLTNNCSQSVFWPLPTVTDNCSATIAASADDPSVNINYNPNTNDCEAFFPVGTTTVTHTATDGSGNTDDCSFTVTVVDNQPPTISCPDNISKNSALGQCGAVATFNPPTGTDNCPGAVTSTPSGQQGSGGFFEVGETTLTFNVVDAAGLTASCSFTVTVIDVENPTIACPGNISEDNDEGICGAAITYTTPTGADNCPGFTTVLTGGLASGAEFPVGTTPVEYTVTDGAGLTASCSFVVTVTDNEAPTVTSCPSNITQDNDGGFCEAVINYSPVAGADNCPGVTVALTEGLASGSAFSVGTTLVEYTVTDAAGLTANCSFDVTVNDAEDPTISCPANITKDNDTGVCGAAVAFADATGADNCTGSSVSQTGGPASGSTFPVGTTPVTYTVTDAAGLTANCSFTVTVNDAEDPVINNCPDGQTLVQANDQGLCGAQVSFTSDPMGITADDNCEVLEVTRDPELLTNFKEGFFDVGTHTMTFTAEDINGNTSDCSFTVTVNDAENPTVSCPANITVDNDNGICGAVVNYAAPVGADNCPGFSVSQTAGLGSGATFPKGTTTETFVVTDAVGLTGTCSFTVTVNDAEDPTVSCPASITVDNDAGICGAAVTFADATGDDNCPGSSVSRTGGLASGSTFPVGTTPVEYTVTDAAGLSVSCSFNVTVNDAESPVLNCPSAVTVNNESGACGAVVTYSVSATDNCPVVNFSKIGGLGSGSFFTVGEHVESYLATDAAGNGVACAFIVTVNDTEAPSITCPENIVLCGAQNVTWNLTTGDNCGVYDSGCTPASGSFFDVGLTSVNCTVIDVNGNPNNCNFTVLIHALPAVSIGTSALPFGCQGLGVVKANVTNQAQLMLPLSYDWSGGLGIDHEAIVTTNGTYTVSVEDARGCEGTASITTTFNPYTSLSSYTMLSTKEVQLKESNVTGGVGVAASNKKAKIKYDSHVTGFVQAPDIDLNGGSTVNGGSNYPYPNNPAYGAANVTLPLFKLNNQSSGSSPELKVEEGETVIISSPNNVYDKIEVKEGGTLIVDGSIGTLYVEEIKTKDDASIVFNGNTEVLVQKDVKLYKNNSVGPSGPYTVNFYIEKDLEVKENSTFTANAYALKKIQAKGKDDGVITMTGIFISEYKIDSDHANWNANSNCGLNLTSNPFLLAFEDDLLQLIATSDENTVNLLWLTNTEYKNVYFEMERSANGFDFEPIFEVDRKYYGHSLKQYFDVDIRPAVGPNYYRVKAIFDDGSHLYSEIRRVDFEMDLGELNLWPNPAVDFIKAFHEQYVGHGAEVQIVNNLGQPVLVQTFDELSDSPMRFELDRFKEGAYQFIIKVDGFRMITKTFVVVKTY